MKKFFIPFVAFSYAMVFGAAGDFTASQHQSFLLKAEEVWASGKFSDNLVPYADAGIKQLNEQTAMFPELDNKDKDNHVDVTWLKMCGETTSDFNRATDVCSISGNELESDSKRYEYNLDQKWGFTIDEEKIRTGTYELDTQVAYGMMEGDKLLSEWLTKQILVFYKANAGDNIAVIKGIDDIMTWDDANKTTNIAAGSYNTAMIGSLIQQMKMNRMRGWYMNDGTLFQAWTNAGLSSGNLDGKGDDERSKQIDLSFDMWNFADAGVDENMFMIDRNAVAVKTYTRFTDEPDEKGGKVNQTWYRMKSNILPDVYWDVIYEMTCTAGNIKHTFQMNTVAGIFLNPEPCPRTINGTEYTPNGIVMYKKVA